MCYATMRRAGDRTLQGTEPIDGDIALCGVRTIGLHDHGAWDGIDREDTAPCGVQEPHTAKSGTDLLREESVRFAVMRCFRSSE